MSSESVGGIFGAIVAAVVLAVAVVFGPIGQYGKPPKPKVEVGALARPAPPGSDDLALEPAPADDHALQGYFSLHAVYWQFKPINEPLGHLNIQSI